MANKFTLEDIRKIRDLTGVGLTDAKRALEEHPDFETALEAMRAKGLSRADRRADRQATAGIIQSYIHDSRIGALVEVNCETDFAAKNELFLALAKDLALQITATDPLYIVPDDVPAGQESNESEDGERCLWKQPCVKEPEISVGEMVERCMAQLGEKIVVSRFVRFNLGRDGCLIGGRDGG